MNISKITIGRLFNLGNYEHIRYEVTVDIAYGESAAQAVRGLENIMAGLKPVEKCGVHSIDELKRATDKLARMNALDATEWEREFGHYDMPRSAVIQRCAEELEENKEKTHAALARASKARELFDNLGGAVAFTDAKDNWEDSF